jgi:hypothetical protein
MGFCDVGYEHLGTTTTEKFLHGRVYATCHGVSVCPSVHIRNATLNKPILAQLVIVSLCEEMLELFPRSAKDRYIVSEYCLSFVSRWKIYCARW